MIVLTDVFIREHPVLLYGIFSSQDMAKNINMKSVRKVINLLQLKDNGNAIKDRKKGKLIEAIPRGLKQGFHWDAAQMNGFVEQYNRAANVNLNETVFFTKEDAAAIVEWVGSIYEP